MKATTSRAVRSTGFVGLPASDRKCPECNGNCAWIDWSVRGRERFVPCSRCGGTGRVKTRASRKPNVAGERQAPAESQETIQ